MTAADPELLADGIYRDPGVGRLTRLALLTLAALAIFCLVGTASSVVAACTFAALAVVLLSVRAVLARPRLIVRPEGLVVVRRVGRRPLAWTEVAWAGAVPAGPPFAAVERLLAVRDLQGHEVRVTCLRDAVDPESGVAPRVEELAASLLARAAWSTSPA